MARDRARTALLLAAVLLSAGCVAAPSATPTPAPGSDVRVDVSSDHDAAYVITVGVASADHAGLAIEFADGTVREFPDARSFEDLPSVSVSRAVSVRPFGDDVQTRRYRWDGPQGASAAFDDAPPNATVFYAVAAPAGAEPMRTFGRATCGLEASLTTVGIRIAPDGSVGVATECRDE